MESLQASYPWTINPLMVPTPLVNMTMAGSAVPSSEAGGLGISAGGFDLSSPLEGLADAAELLKGPDNAFQDGLFKSLPE